jgi:hypothetical protein
MKISEKAGHLTSQSAQTYGNLIEFALEDSLLQSKHFHQSRLWIF